MWNNIGSIKKELKKDGLIINDIFKVVVKSGEKTLF